MEDFRRVIYHADHEPKIIMDSEFHPYEKEGWCDTPARVYDAKKVDLASATVTVKEPKKAGRPKGWRKRK